MTESAPNWAEFEQAVAQLFRLSGYEVQNSSLRGHKKVDLVVAETRFGKTRRTAVECKSYKRPLTQEYVNKIYSNYRGLIPGHVDDILIVTENGLAPSAATMVDESPDLAHRTYAELVHGIMHFVPYLRQQVRQFAEDGLKDYYVPVRGEHIDDLEAWIDQWIAGDGARPIAILGSYGQGKSTFARRLSATLADRALSHARHRVPLLLKLGDIAAEQSLEGLLGKVFTQGNAVRGYNFSTFMDLNAAGRFVILLDGFDEMKQALTPSEFRYNFQQLNRLVTPASRVVMLGRPTAFVSDAEQQYILHGMRSRAGQEGKEPEWPDYEEIRLAPFTISDIEFFLTRYVDHLRRSARSEGERARYDALRNVSARHLVEVGLAELSKRPVQLKMVVEVLPDFRGDLANLTEHTLYDYFIDYVIERETEKQARQLFSPAERRRFSRSVAVWLWKDRRDSILSQDAVPAELVEPFVRGAFQIDAITRDLLSASPMDRKAGGRLHFPHRSFQEFLVAEAVGKEGHGRYSIGETLAMLTPDVLNFLHGFMDERLARRLVNELDGYTGSAPMEFLKQIAERVGSELEGKTPWQLLIMAVASHGVGNSTLNIGQVIERYVSEASESRAIVVALYAALIASRKNGAGHLVLETLEAIRKVVNAQVLRVKAAQAKRPLGSATKIWKRKNVVVVDNFLREAPALILSTLQFSERTSSVNIMGLYRILRGELREYAYVADWDDGEHLDRRSAGLPERVYAPERFQKDVAATLGQLEQVR